MLCASLVAGCPSNNDAGAIASFAVENAASERIRVTILIDDEPLAIDVAPGEFGTAEFDKCPTRIEFQSLTVGEGDAQRSASFDAAPFQALERDVTFACNSEIAVRVTVESTEVTVDPGVAGAARARAVVAISTQHR